MHASFDEIRRLAFRALDAGGAAAGIDEDSAYAIAWLEAAGINGCKTLADALDGTPARERAKGLEIVSRDEAHCDLDGGSRSAVFYGPSVIDLAAGLAESSSGGRATLTVRSVRHPAVLLAAAARYCPHGGSIRLAWNGVECTAVRGNASCGPKSPDPADDDAYDVTITCTLPAEEDEADHSISLSRRLQSALSDGLEVDDEAHARVSAYAAKILVPESETSRLEGAGAGLTDND